MYVNPGELDKKIEILNRKSAKDADGFLLGEYESVKKCWAKYSRKTGNTSTQSGTELDNIVTRFLIRYTGTKITKNMIIRYDGRYFDIEYVNDIQDRHEYIELFCKEGVQ